MATTTRSRQHFLQRLQPELLEQNLEERVHRSEQDAVEAPLDDVEVAKFVQVPTDDIEEAERNQGEAVEKQDLVERPVLQLGNLGKENQDEAETQHRGRHGGEEGDEEIRLVREADLRVLREVKKKQPEVSFHAKWRRPLRPGGSRGAPSFRLPVSLVADVVVVGEVGDDQTMQL